MKSFFVEREARESTIPQIEKPPVESSHTAPVATQNAHSARLAVYDSLSAAPRVADIEATSVDDFIESVSSATYQAARDLGGDIPYTAIREIAENLIHANFTDPVVSVMEEGRTVRFADRGPGISDKRRAVLPGFTTASGAMKKHIRGVGSGLPIVREYLDHHEGVLEIDDNLGGGAVITLKGTPPTRNPAAPVPPLSGAVSMAPTEQSGQTHIPNLDPHRTSRDPLPPLSMRHKRVLSLVLEMGAAGPTLVSKELRVGLSTAHRDLAYLERAGLIVADDGGKRVLTDAGSKYINALFD